MFSWGTVYIKKKYFLRNKYLVSFLFGGRKGGNGMIIIKSKIIHEIKKLNENGKAMAVSATTHEKFFEKIH